MENEDQNAKVQLAADVVNHFWHLGIKTSESEMRTNSFSKNENFRTSCLTKLPNLAFRAIRTKLLKFKERKHEKKKYHCPFV